MTTIHILPDWHENEQAMPQGNDSIHQAQLFQSQGCDVNLLLVDYLTRLRSMFHTKNLDHVTYWSLYDDIQEVGLTDTRVVALQDFSWPETVYFVEMPDQIVAMQDDKLFAKIQLDGDNLGQIVAIIFYENDHQKTCLDIDDRGFVSRTTYFVNGEKTAVDYLTPSGEVAMHVSLPDQAVTTKETWFGAKKFANTTVLFQAILKQKISKISDEAPLIVAQTDVINQFLLENDIQHDIIYSAQERRETSKMTLPQCVKAVVTDNVSTTMVNQHYIPTFATILSEGKSQETANLDYYWVADQTIAQQLAVVSQFITILRDNEHARVIVDTPVALSQAVTNLIETSDQSTDIDDELLDNNGLSDELKMAGNQPATIKTFAERFIINIAPTEEKQQRAIEKVRVLVDLNTQPNAYLQTLALSALIPQINAVKTPFVLANQNGFIIDDVNELSAKIQFYQHNINDWAFAKNEAFKHSENYYDTVLWSKWQRVFDQVKPLGE